MIVNLLHRDCRVAAKFAFDLAILVDSRVHVEQQAPDCCEFAKLTREFFVSQSSSPSSPVKLCFMLPQADLCVRNKLAVLFAARILAIIVSFCHVLNKRVRRRRSRKIAALRSAKNFFLFFYFPNKLVAVFVEKIDMLFGKAEF